MSSHLQNIPPQKKKLGQLWASRVVYTFHYFLARNISSIWNNSPTPPSSFWFTVVLVPLSLFPVGAQRCRVAWCFGKIFVNVVQGEMSISDTQIGIEVRCLLEKLLLWMVGGGYELSTLPCLDPWDVWYILSTWKTHKHLGWLYIFYLHEKKHKTSTIQVSVNVESSHGSWGLWLGFLFGDVKICVWSFGKWCLLLTQTKRITTCLKCD